MSPVAPKMATASPVDLPAATPEAGGDVAAFEQLIAALFTPGRAPDPIAIEQAASAVEGLEGVDAEEATMLPEATPENPLAAIVASLPQLAELPSTAPRLADQPAVTAFEVVAKPGAPATVAPVLSEAVAVAAAPAELKTPLQKQAPQPAEIAPELPEIAAPILPLLKLVQTRSEPAQVQPLPVEHQASSAAAPLIPDLPPSLAALPSTAASPLPTAIGAAVQPDAAAQVIEQQLDLAHEGEWLDRLARDIARTADNEGTLKFRLNPETLGTLKVEVTQGAAGASVRLTADTETARTIIADAQPRLVAEARAQGVRIAETHVDLGAQGGAGDPRRQQAPQPETLIRTAGAERAAEADAERSDRERYA